MALPKRNGHTETSKLNYEAGGPVAMMHQSIEGQLLPAQTILPEWTDYMEALSPTEDAVRMLSRVMGVVAMAAGIASVLIMVARIV